MFNSFYGLKENPFNVTPDPQYMYLGENHREALAQLLYGVKEGKGFIVLTGEVGTGKTTIIRYFLDKLNGNPRTHTAFLFNPKMTVHDFLHYILQDLGVAPQGTNKGDYLHSLQKFLLEAYNKNEKVVLIVDEAQGLAPQLLEEIRLLSNLETSKRKLLQIILVGQPELNKTLMQREFRQLRQRINLKYHLSPLSKKETKEYIQNRVRIAGGKGALFSEGAMREIYRRAEGIPRLINILADNSLLNGYAADQKVIDKEAVREAARDLRVKRGLLGTRTWVLLGIFMIGCILSYAILQNTGRMASIFADFTLRFHPLKESIGNWMQTVFK